jgi:hypothetical protein
MRHKSLPIRCINLPKVALTYSQVGSPTTDEPQQLLSKIKVPDFQGTRFMLNATADYLLLVIDRYTFVLFALRIGSIDSNRPALAVGGKHHVGREHNLAVFF